MSNEYFKQALSDFTLDFASGGAIRAMADKGYTVRQIKERLDFPIPLEKVKEIVWKHYVDNGVILLKEPGNISNRNTADGETAEKDISEKHRVTYEKVQDRYGRTSFKQVIVKEDATDLAPKEYVACDFGKKIYQDRRAFEKSLGVLKEEDREYIMDLPWPLTTVWHVKNERMERITAKIRN
ncbi:MAG: hypothetical protein IKO32_02335 [Lachnospiraceae bacterium]|nr:hypothetical protein [Lachnospiraceae bacterium]